MDFIKCIPNPIENILLLKGNYCGKTIKHGFDLIEGESEIKKLIAESTRGYGDLCFVDYSISDSIEHLSKEQIAELLYLSHMFEPLKSPFFKTLQNEIVYLSHDDGWYCKLYYKKQGLPVSIICNKLLCEIGRIKKSDICMLSADLMAKIEELSVLGVLIEMKVSRTIHPIVTVNLFEVDECANMSFMHDGGGNIIAPKMSFKI